MRLLLKTTSLHTRLFALLPMRLVRIYHARVGDNTSDYVYVHFWSD